MTDKNPRSSSPPKKSAVSPRPRRWATIDETAEYLGCSRRTIEQRLAHGKLPLFKNGRLVLIDLNDVDDMVERSVDR